MVGRLLHVTANWLACGSFGSKRYVSARVCQRMSAEEQPIAIAAMLRVYDTHFKAIAGS